MRIGADGCGCVDGCGDHDHDAQGDSCLSDECVVFVTFAGPHDGMLAGEAG